MNKATDKIKTTVGSQVITNPEISVIIPSYNSARYIAETLDSVLAQTFETYEAMVINDASPDIVEFREALKPYLDKIIFIDKTVNEGTSATRNFATGLAKGKYIAFLDADDIWQPEYLSELHERLTQNNLDMAYTDAVTFGETLAKPADLRRDNPEQSCIITRQMLIEGKCHILPSGTLIKKQVLLEMGGFDPKVLRTEDFDLWMRMLFNGVKIGYLRKLLFKFRISPDSMSGDSIVRLQRCGDGWHNLLEKLNFTDGENAIIDRHIKDNEAAVLRAKGRLNIVRENWNEAKENFRDAHNLANNLGLPLKHRLKLTAIRFLLNTSPSLLSRLFNKFRAEEIEYMPGQPSQGLVKKFNRI